MIEFSTEPRGDACVVAVKGRLDMVGAPRLREVIANTVDAGQARIVVDLSATDFVDSSGLGAVVSGLKTTRQAGGDLRIAGVGGQVAVVLKLTNLDKVLRSYASVDEAVGALG